MLNLKDTQQFNFLLKIGKPKTVEEYIKVQSVLETLKYFAEYTQLSEEFIRKFKYFLDWKSISIYQKLSEDFIREFKDFVDWKQIWSNPNINVSKVFRKEFKDYGK